jgi:glycosyltransferase involved in cell wall biosynthesis
MPVRGAEAAARISLAILYGVPRSHFRRQEPAIYKDRRIAVLVPAFNEAAHVGDVVRTAPDFVDDIIVVDDASGDGTGQAALAVGDPRVVLITHPVNQGLGATLVDAHKEAIARDADISVVMAGDGQMDPAYLPALLDPIVEDGYDFTKGNRFFARNSWKGMPRHRILGNILLTFLTKLATGYWDIFDPQNGYTAITRDAQREIDWDSVARDYSFENDVLGWLALDKRRVKDVRIPAVYGSEVSDIRLGTVVPAILRTLRRVFWRRIMVNYVVASFSPVALFLFSSLLMGLWSLGFGAWVVAQKLGGTTPTTATVMLVVLPFLMGFELMLAALVLDIVNTPK